MSEIIVSEFVLDYMTRLSQLLGNDSLKHYGDIVEEIEESEQTYSNDQLKAVILEKIRLHSDDQRTLDRHVAKGFEGEFGHEVLTHWDTLPHRLVESHWSLIKQVSAAYHREAKLDNDHEFKDAMSVAQEALLEAANKYFKKPKDDFKSFAWKIMKQRVKEEQSRKHPVPFKVRKKLRKLADLREEYSYKEDSLSKEDIAQQLNVSDQDLDNLLETEAVWGSGLEIETDVELDDLEEADASPSALAMLVNIENERILNQAIGQLNEKEQDLIQGLYFKDQTARELAETMELSLSVLKKHHKKALIKLKRIVDDFEQ